MSKPKWLILILIFFLTGCSGYAKLPQLASNCQNPGTIINTQVEATERGYPYRFAIYLPPCYEADISTGYPVIYLIPGRGGGPGDWFSAGAGEIADELILSGDLPPFIIVTTESTNNDAYAEAIYAELIPHIDTEYHTIPSRKYRAVGGGSLGGVAAYRLNLQYPTDFASTGIFGSGVINGEQKQVKSWLENINSAQKPRFYLNSGEGDPLMLVQAQEMTMILEEFEIAYQLEVGDGAHTYAYWASNLGNYFRWVAEDW